MSTTLALWEQILVVIISFGLIALLYFQVKRNPTAFSLKKMNEAIWTVGLLALGLIGFIALLVWFIRHVR